MVECVKRRGNEGYGSLEGRMMERDVFEGGKEGSESEGSRGEEGGWVMGKGREREREEEARWRE